jgi:hypothetical protein
MSTRLFRDCDTGIDDPLALLYLHLSAPRLDRPPQSTPESRVNSRS